jgi:DNA modification methylase
MPVGGHEESVRHNPIGRFPANLLLSHNPDCWIDIINGQEKYTCTEGCPVAELDRQSGVSKDTERKSKGLSPAGNGRTHGEMAEIEHRRGFADSGGASRFFYVAKASKKDKGAGNTHPTVKSQALMSYLIKLITPPGGVVLDPFLGSGSTGVAAITNGFSFIGIEKEAEYFAIAEARINAADTLDKIA